MDYEGCWFQMKPKEDGKNDFGQEMQSRYRENGMHKESMQNRSYGMRDNRMYCHGKYCSGNFDEWSDYGYEWFGKQKKDKMQKIDVKGVKGTKGIKGSGIEDKVENIKGEEVLAPVA